VRFPLIVFDLDGTLCDSLPDIAAALNRGLAELGRPPIAPALVRTLVGEGVVRLAEKALAVAAQGPPAPAQAQALAERVRGIYRERPCVATTIYPGMADTLAALRAPAGRRLCVLTNKPGEVARPLLDALAFPITFDAIVGDGDGYPRKPDPAAIHALAARFGASAADTLVVGDGLPDLAVARAAGCQVAAALWGYTDPEPLRAQAPDFTLATPPDLLAIA
jgi:phosphoglycolate phosphatase